MAGRPQLDGPAGRQARAAETTRPTACPCWRRSSSSSGTSCPGSPPSRATAGSPCRPCSACTTPRSRTSLGAACDAALNQGRGSTRADARREIARGALANKPGHKLRKQPLRPITITPLPPSPAAPSLFLYAAAAHHTCARAVHRALAHPRSAFTRRRPSWGVVAGGGGGRRRSASHRRCSRWTAFDRKRKRIAGERRIAAEKLEKRKSTFRGDISVVLSLHLCAPNTHTS
ncbi:unnamed protein product [Chondrus crispus]|uniref:Uncharacterized protein n=1 Tax=Chondrus crispus TaxID=2769 RepID=R7Q7Z2_CHOCR|nr:unnamed protein product [Chondrus crispus]CDF34154.1 unnamed protein product [Chondrus crispus]|eukprot:XP_005713973.1 unnamed protein product [Chondrus crispus]